MESGKPFLNGASPAKPKEQETKKSIITIVLIFYKIEI